MVNQGEQCMEDLIIQVFEEHEEQFYFPVTTQKDARSFIKAMHIKGIQYDSICEEIGEFEHNFSAWRKGLGRAGIGNRVIELINKPFQQLLLSDSEESGDEAETNGGGAVDVRRLQQVVDKAAHTNGDTVVRPRVEERLPLHQDRSAQREKQGEIAESWRKNIEKNAPAAAAAAEEEAEQASAGQGGDDEVSKSSRESSRESSVENNNSVTLETIKLRRVDRKSEEPPVVVMREKKEGNFERTLSFREKLQKARERESKTISGSGLTRDSPPSTPELNGQSSRQSSAEPEISNNKPAEEKCISDVLQNGQAQEPQADLVTPEEELAEGTDPGAKDECNSSSGSSGSDSADGAENLVLSGEAEDEEGADAVVREDSSNSSNSSDSGDESDASTELSSAGDDIPVSENYDSDLDLDGQDGASEMAALLGQLAALKARASDGPGFIYVFSDQSAGAVHRVKVGSSRFPNKRLEQAKSFNTEMRLASACAVSPREAALGEVYERLRPHQLADSAGWYRAPLDDILEAVSAVAAKYPSESSDC